jgi:hypothetical protein
LIEGLSSVVKWCLSFGGITSAESVGPSYYPNDQIALIL